MKQEAENVGKSTSNSKYRAYGIVTLCVLLIFGLPSCRKRRSAPRTYRHPNPSQVEVSRTQEPPKSPPPSPPDIRPCTRIEIRLLPSTLEWVCITRRERSLLSREELEYLLDLKGIVVDNQQQIQDLAHELSSVSYRGPVEPPPLIKEHVYVLCYQNNKYLTSFTVWASRIMMGDGNEFRFQNDRIWASILPMIDQIRPLQLRVRCAGKLRGLGDSLRYWPADNKAYPSPSEWCDAIVRKYQDKGTSKEYMLIFFKCPSTPS